MISLVSSSLLALCVASPVGATTKKEDPAKARAALIVKSDFPKGWTTSKSDNSKDTTGNAQLAKCMGVPVSEINYNPPSVYSPQFDDDFYSVDDNVAMFPSKKVANEQLELFASSKTAGCMTTVFNSPSMKQYEEKSFAKGSKLGTISVKALPHPLASLQAVGYTIAFPLTESGTKFSVAATTVIIVNGKLGADLTFTSAIGAFPAKLESHLEAVSATRLG